MKKLVLLVLVLGVVLGPASTVFADVPAPGGPFNTSFRVQNLGGANANCEFSFYDASGVAAYSSGALPAIAPGDALYVYVPNDTTVADGMYSAVVSCDQDVAAVVNISDADSGASYSGVGGGEVASTLYAPAVYDNYYNFYSDVVVQKSTREGFGLTVAEAMWKGRPVIGGNCGGIKLQIRNGVTGFLVSDVESCANRIVTLLQDRKMASLMGYKARESVRRNYLMPRLLRDYLQLMLALSYRQDKVSTNPGN